MIMKVKALISLLALSVSGAASATIDCMAGDATSGCIRGPGSIGGTPITFKYDETLQNPSSGYISGYAVINAYESSYTTELLDNNKDVTVYLACVTDSQEQQENDPGTTWIPLAVKLVAASNVNLSDISTYNVTQGVDTTTQADVHVQFTTPATGINGATKSSYTFNVLCGPVPTAFPDKPWPGAVSDREYKAKQEIAAKQAAE